MIIPVEPASGTFTRNHLWVPLILFAVSLATIELLGLDRLIAHAWYYDETTRQWLGSGSGEWWARTLLHQCGRWVVRGVVICAAGIWAASFAFGRLRTLRRPAGYVAASMIAAMLVVGALKAVTNVDCPWDLSDFGGKNPYIGIFAARPDGLPHAACFPGAHSSSGFSLMCLYFLWREKSPRLAAWGLAAGIAVGVAFSIGQEARGAHFLSHDLTSAALVWFVQLGLYRLLLCPAATASATGR
ncbi:MAG: phosphatase PAP2 family protein [Steroidobacteraceae bacterium]